MKMLDIIAFFLKLVIKFIIGYFFLGMIAITLFFICIGILDIITVFSALDWNIAEIISQTEAMSIEEIGIRIYSVFSKDFPFGEILDTLIEGDGGVGNVFDIVSAIFSRNFAKSFKEHYYTIFPSIIVVVIANFFIWLFCRINVFISKFLSGRTFEIATIIPMAIFGATAFFIAIIIKKIIEILVPKQIFSIVLFVVGLLFFFLHMIVLSRKSKWQNVFMYLIFSIFDGIVCSILTWGICFSIGRFFTTDNYLTVIIALMQYILVYGVLQWLHGKLLEFRIFT